MKIKRKLSLVIITVCLALSWNVNGDILGSIKSFWYNYGSPKRDMPLSPSTSSSKLLPRQGYYGDDPYMMSPRGGWGWGWPKDDHQNLDLYSLLGGLSFASLLGATIIYLARRNTSGRRRRSIDGSRYVDEDEDLDQDDPTTKGISIVELIDSFLENANIFSGKDKEENQLIRQNETKRSVQHFHGKMHLGPGVVPVRLFSKR